MGDEMKLVRGILFGGTGPAELFSKKKKQNLPAGRHIYPWAEVGGTI